MIQTIEKVQHHNFSGMPGQPDDAFDSDLIAFVEIEGLVQSTHSEFHVLFVDQDRYLDFRR
jgi:hypothetical protein